MCRTEDQALVCQREAERFRGMYLKFRLLLSDVDSRQCLQISRRHGPINTYDSKDTTLDALVENLMNGEEAFKGTDPIDSFCGLFDARL